MDINQELTQEQKDYLENQLAAGVAFEEMVNSKGFEIIKSYYEDQVKNLNNLMLNTPERKITDFEAARWEVIGLKKLFTKIYSSIQTLQDERSKKQPS